MTFGLSLNNKCCEGLLKGGSSGYFDVSGEGLIVEGDGNVLWDGNAILLNHH